MFVRLFGNKKSLNIPWGTIEENGVGKFADITEKALSEIHDLGVTHIWYTGVLHHALVRDYSRYGIRNDDPAVVKGRAGSPYAIKDYYTVNPDLALDPSRSIDEFKALIDRSHQQNLKVIIDLVPNHVSRNYCGLNNPVGINDFGSQDNVSVSYQRDNNFYYIPGEPFQIPEWRNGYQPLGGRDPLIEYEKHEENPAKWTGNGSRNPQPDFNDWYETAKLNFGISPEGRKDFDQLPESFRSKDVKTHYRFWYDKVVPDTWNKFVEITEFWLSLGVDGFRFDMAEMVPVEFWSYLNSSIKTKYPKTILIAEIYNPSLYRDFIQLGKMDYLYDKVDFYDGIKHIMKGYGWTDHLPVVQQRLSDIENHMLHFLENHDEQRIASPQFVGDPQIGKPAMVVSATMGSSPIMIYFGQEVGEPAEENPGFGNPSRTSIFDYVGVPAHQRWMNGGLFDGGLLSPKEKELRYFYKKLLRFTKGCSALSGKYEEIHFFNKEHTKGYDHRVLSYLRWDDHEKLIVVSNFDPHLSYHFELQIPRVVSQQWHMEDGEYTLNEILTDTEHYTLSIQRGLGKIRLSLQPLESLLLIIKA